MNIFIFRPTSLYEITFVKIKQQILSVSTCVLLSRDRDVDPIQFLPLSPSKQGGGVRGKGKGVEMGLGRGPLS